MPDASEFVTREEWDEARVKDMQRVREILSLVDQTIEIMELYREQLKGIEQDIELRHPAPAD